MRILLLLLAAAAPASAAEFRLSSRVVTLTFGVEAAATALSPLDNVHLDIQLPYLQGGFFGQRYQTIGEAPAGTPADSYLSVNATNRLSLSQQQLATFGFIGAEADETFWLLPQGLRFGQPLNYLYLGLAADTITPAARAEMVPWNPGDPRVSSSPQPWTELRLRGVRSPSGTGKFSLFQLNSQSQPTVFMASSDGVGEQDKVWINAGSHAHYNWAFTEPGVWEVDVQAFTRANVARLPGDANLDGRVTISDFAILRANFGKFGDWSMGDFTGTGQVTISDFAILRANFGAGTAMTSAEFDAEASALDAWAATIPEPSLSLVALAGGALLTRRR